MTVKDLNYFGQVWPGFIGAATYWVTDVEQLCDRNGDGRTDIEPVMPSVVVLNYGHHQEIDPFKHPDEYDPVWPDEGDVTRIYEATPYYFRASDCIVEVCGTVSTRRRRIPSGMRSQRTSGAWRSMSWSATRDPSMQRAMPTSHPKAKTALVRKGMPGWMTLW
jgi:hypothetical protein